MSELALRLIAENKRTRARLLDLGNCGLEELPRELEELLWLEELNLASEWYVWTGKRWEHKKSQNTGVANERLSDLAPLAKLARLQTLILRGSSASDLTPLSEVSRLEVLDASGAAIVDLTPLASLSGLRTLDVYDTQIADLTPLASLSALRFVNASYTHVTDLAPLACLSGLQSLYLNSTRVANLTPLASLSALQTLHINGTRVADLAPLASLSALQSLHANNTQVADLAPLASLSALQSLHSSNTQVVDLAPLASLSALRSLGVSGTRVADLTPLASLSALEALHLRGAPVIDLAPLASLSALTSLDVAITRITDLVPLAHHSALKCLDVSGTRIADLAPLASLSALEVLDISNTRVADLSPLRTLIDRGCPVRWSTASSRKPAVYVGGCPLTRPPVEVVKQGNEAILNYFRERETADVVHLYEAKMLLVGDGKAGKTSLLRRLFQPELGLPTEDETTKGITIHTHEFKLKDGQPFRLNAWDFGSQQIYHATHQFFLTRRSLYVLLDDTRNDDKSVSDERFRYWLEAIDLWGEHSPVLIFQNERGGRSKEIDLAGIKGRFDNVIERFAGDLSHPDAACGLRDAVEYHASHMRHIGDELPAGWVKVREELEKRAASVPTISESEYFEIYGRHLPFDAAEEADRKKARFLSQYLHELGVFLHFQEHDLLRRTVILQNAWATDAVLRILDDEQVKQKQRGRFTRADCDRLWHDQTYQDKHLELWALMQKFELCYLLEGKAPRTWLVPQLLPATKPQELKDWAEPGDLVLRYAYEFLPKGVISRLTVRLQRFVRDPELAWVTGVRFERDGTEVVVELLPNGTEIELRARGPEQKELLSVVVADLDALNDSFQGLRDRVDKRIPCPCAECSRQPVPHFFAYKDLVRRKGRGRLRVECERSYASMDVLDLLHGIRVSSPPSSLPSPSSVPRTARTLRVFLASSSELRDDRDAFDLYFRQQNDEFLRLGVYLEITRWENFLDAINETRKQDDYNRAVRECDVFIGLFFTKVGRFAEEEFDTAYGQFKARGRPRIFTFFRHSDVNIGTLRKEDVESVWAFQERLGALGHFWTVYRNDADLKLQFRTQLDKLLAEDS
ncbi:MAG: hypothetical protein JW940_19370 [Polyangiaceae bacterium]|nr:hypothetical protein [Polyangiaceae bacterium]